MKVPYCTFFGKSYPYYIEYRIGVEPSVDKTFTNIEYIAPVKDVRTGEDVLETFDSIRCKTGLSRHWYLSACLTRERKNIILMMFLLETGYGE